MKPSISNEHTLATGFPFGFSRDDYFADLRFRETRDLMAEINSWQWLGPDVADLLDGSRAYVEHQLAAMVSELERRQRLLKTYHRDPLRPTWPKQSSDALQNRVQAVKAAWPIERFCRELLLCNLIPTGVGRWKTRCPLPGHDDHTPSFVVTASNDFAWCFGIDCLRGGDVIKLAQYVLNIERFLDGLAYLEREGGVR